MNLPVDNVPHQPVPPPQEIRARLDPPTSRFGPVPSLPDHLEVGGHPVGRVGPRAAAALIDTLLLTVPLLAALAPEMVWANGRTDGAWWVASARRRWHSPPPSSSLRRRGTSPSRSRGGVRRPRRTGRCRAGGDRESPVNR